jgi:hypothetical protein
MGFATRPGSGKGGRDEGDGDGDGGGRGGRAAARKASSSWSSLKQRKVTLGKGDLGDYGAGYKRKAPPDSDDDY